MKHQIIYIIIILILAFLLLNKCGNKPIEVIRNNNDSLFEEINRSKINAAIAMNNANVYKVLADSLKTVKSKILTRYVNRYTTCDTVVMISEKIIEKQDTVIVNLTKVVLIKDTIIKNDSLIIANNIVQLKQVKKQNRKRVILSFLGGALLGTFIPR